MPAPPTSLNECFFFIFLVVELSYDLIFWQFWLFFVFKLIVFLLLVVGGIEVYLPMPPYWLDVRKLALKKKDFIYFLGRGEGRKRNIDV